MKLAMSALEAFGYKSGGDVNMHLATIILASISVMKCRQDNVPTCLLVMDTRPKRGASDVSASAARCHGTPSCGSHRRLCIGPYTGEFWFIYGFLCVWAKVRGLW